VLRNIALFYDGLIVTIAMLSRLDSQAAPRLLGNGPGVDVPRPASGSSASVRVKPLWQVERTAIEEALAVCGGNVPRAAAILEVNPSTIHRRKAEWGKGRLARSV
jgi:two-component system, repressor protein LuxO